MQTNRIHISDIADARRMDPIFFRFGTARFGHTFKLTSIGSVVVDMQSGFGAGKGDQASEEDGIIHIRPTNIDNEGNLIFEKNVYVPSNLKKQMLSKGDVLFNNTNSQELVGKTAILREERDLFFSNHITRIRVDQQRIIPEFIWIILNLYQQEKIFYSICTNWNNQSGVGLELLKSLKIPLPPMEVQREIVELYTKAQVEKQAKEAQAKALLDSIDSYLLDQLGINLPKKQDNQSERFYLGNVSSLLGERYDPYYHKPYFEKAFDALRESKYKLHILREISSVITSGITPLSGGDAYTNSEEGVAFIRSGDIDIDGDILFDDLLYIKPEIHNKKMKSSKVYDNDIMIAIVGATIGQVGIYHSNKEANINQAIALVRLKGVINHEYIKEVIKSAIGQLNLDRLKRPVARANINLEEIASIMIPIPPIEKQNEIADYISQIRAKAKQLQAEALQTLATAKQTIKKMILK